MDRLDEGSCGIRVCGEGITKKGFKEANDSILPHVFEQIFRRVGRKPKEHIDGVLDVVVQLSRAGRNGSKCEMVLIGKEGEFVDHG